MQVLFEGGYYSRAGTIISSGCTYNLPVNKELPDYVDVPPFCRTFRTFYHFQLESGIVALFFLLFEASSAAVAISDCWVHSIMKTTCAKQ